MGSTLPGRGWTQNCRGAMIFDRSSRIAPVSETRVSTPKVDSELPPSEDPLADPLRLLRLTGVLHCQAELTAPWGLDLPRIPNCMAIHIVNSGRLFLDIAGQPTRAIEAGSLVMVPHGTAHQLRSEPGTPVTLLTEVPVQLITDRYERMNFGGGGMLTSISYCGVRFDPLGARRLMQVLPLVIQLDTLSQEDEWLRDTARFIAREAVASLDPARYSAANGCSEPIVRIGEWRSIRREVREAEVRCGQPQGPLSARSYFSKRLSQW